MILYDRAPRLSMSLTPLDERDGHPGEDENPGVERETDRSVAERLLGRVRSAFGRLAAAVRRPFGSSATAVERPPDRRLDDDRDPGATRPGRSTKRSPPVLGNDDGARRSSTATVVDVVEPETGPSGDRPELVASWDDGGLTLSEPGDADARISSDTWTEMER